MRLRRYMYVTIRSRGPWTTSIIWATIFNTLIKLGVKYQIQNIWKILFKQIFKYTLHILNYVKFCWNIAPFCATVFEKNVFKDHFFLKFSINSYVKRPPPPRSTPENHNWNKPESNYTWSRPPSPKFPIP